MTEAQDVWHSGLTLRRWTMRNFKAVRESTINLAPLTVVVGANSAGKSTLLQSIRSLVQAVHVSGLAFPLNGDQVRLGTFEETLWHGAGARESEAAVELAASFCTTDYRGSALFGAAAQLSSAGTRSGEPITLDWGISLAGRPAGQAALTLIRRVDLDVASETRGYKLAGSWSQETSDRSAVGSLVGSLRRTGESTSQSLSDIHLLGGFPIRAVGRRRLLPLYVDAWLDVPRAAALESIGRKPSLKTGEHQDAMTANLHSLTTMIADDIKSMLARHSDQEVASLKFERREVAELKQLASSRGFVDFSINATELRKLVGSVEKSIGRTLYGDRSVHLPHLLSQTCEIVRDFLATRVQHLGPLRENPQVVYTVAPLTRSGYLGDKGEFTAAVLQANGQDIVHVPLPPSGSKASGARLTPTTLLHAVNAWSAFLGIADEFATSDEGRIGIRLEVRQGDLALPLDLTSVGTGVSQLLPVILMCLQAPEGSLLLIEQPELHLNPGVQQRLADFLLAVADSGRQLIVETHSDYLVNRLRLRSIADRAQKVARQVSIVFAERIDGETTYSATHPSIDGSLQDWPEGFMDQAARESERILQAMADRRREVVEDVTGRF